MYDYRFSSINPLTKKFFLFFSLLFEFFEKEEAGQGVGKKKAFKHSAFIHNME
jgi:hypothetical protein